MSITITLPVPDRLSAVVPAGATPFDDARGAGREVWPVLGRCCSRWPRTSFPASASRWP